MLSEETGETGVTSALGGEYTERMGGPRRHDPREPEGSPSEGWPGWMVGEGISPLRLGKPPRSMRDDRECTEDIG